MHYYANHWMTRVIAKMLIKNVTDTLKISCTLINVTAKIMLIIEQIVYYLVAKLEYLNKVLAAWPVELFDYSLCPKFALTK